MKMDTGTQDVKVHGDFETSEFAIGDISFIVDMFADKVYTYKERAVIRELSCNAHDSHIMAGTTDIPFDVIFDSDDEDCLGCGDTDDEDTVAPSAASSSSSAGPVAVPAYGGRAMTIWV